MNQRLVDALVALSCAVADANHGSGDCRVHVPRSMYDAICVAYPEPSGHVGMVQLVVHGPGGRVVLAPLEET